MRLKSVTLKVYCLQWNPSENSFNPLSHDCGTSAQSGGISCVNCCGTSLGKHRNSLFIYIDLYIFYMQQIWFKLVLDNDDNFETFILKYFN